MYSCQFQCTVSVTVLQTTVVSTVIQGSNAVFTARIIVPASRAQAKPASAPAKASGAAPAVNGANITKIGPDLRYVTPNPGDAGKFDLYNAGSSAHDWFGGGALVGGGIGCVVGAIPGAIAGAAAAGVGAFVGAGYGCIAAGPTGAGIGGPVGAAVGYYLGGNNLPGADAFEWLPEQVHAPWEKD